MSFSGAFGGTYGGAWGGKPAIAQLAAAFDHGLVRPQRTIVQESVIAMLARLHVQNGGYLQAIEPTAAIVRGSNDDDGIGLLEEDLQGRAPSILVALGDKEYKPAGGMGSRKEWTGDTMIHVYVCCNSLRSRLARLVGDVESRGNSTADPGMHVILEHVEQLVIGESPGGSKGSIKEMLPVAEVQVSANGEYEVWQQTYRCVLTRSIREKRDLTVELQAINTYHHLAEQTDDTPIVAQETDIT